MPLPTIEDPAERRRRSSIAGLTGWANTKDRRARARHAGAGLYRKFEREVDPDGTMPPRERAARAKTLYKLHLAKMTQRSIEARRAGTGSAHD